MASKKKAAEKKTSAKKAARKPSAPKATKKAVRKAVPLAKPEAQPKTRKAVPLDKPEGAAKKLTLNGRAVELVLKQEYTDAVIHEILASEFGSVYPSCASFVRSGINHGVIGKRAVIESGVTLPILRIEG